MAHDPNAYYSTASQRHRGSQSSENTDFLQQTPADIAQKKKNEPNDLMEETRSDLLSLVHGDPKAKKSWNAFLVILENEKKALEKAHQTKKAQALVNLAGQVKTGMDSK